MQWTLKDGDSSNYFITFFSRVRKVNDMFVVKARPNPYSRADQVLPFTCLESNGTEQVGTKHQKERKKEKGVCDVQSLKVNVKRGSNGEPKSYEPSIADSMASSRMSLWSPPACHIANPPRPISLMYWPFAAVQKREGLTSTLPTGEQHKRRTK